MTHWQTQHGRTYLCGEPRLLTDREAAGIHAYPDSICLDSFCGHCGNRRENVDCPQCIAAVERIRRVLDGDVPGYDEEEST